MAVGRLFAFKKIAQKWRVCGCAAVRKKRRVYSTVTLLARLRGLSGSSPRSMHIL